MMIVQIKPRVDIGFHHDLSRKIHMQQRFIHKVIGALKKGNQRIRQVLIDFAFDIGNIFFAVISMRRDQNAVLDPGRIAAVTGEFARVNELHVHVDIHDLQGLLAVRTAKQTEHGKRQTASFDLAGALL